MQTSSYMRSFVLFFVLLSGIVLVGSDALARDSKGRFIVVIDAGHGGHDTGARGHSCREKDIVLDVALKVGKRIKAINPNIIVYYTRSSDVFIGLDNRAEFAIGKHADLFVSIHANASKSHKPCGAETYVLGLHRTQENLEVAMKENSAILLESDYTKKYEDFDPNSSESYIIFEFMQNKYLDSSIKLANFVQQGLVKIGRDNRKVRQAGFLVLRKVSMPSILIELGFITNHAEERFMASTAGQNKLADSIANSIVVYEKSMALRSGL